MHHRLTGHVPHGARRLSSGRLRTSRRGRSLRGCRPSRLRTMSLSNTSRLGFSPRRFSMRRFSLCCRSLHCLRLHGLSLYRLSRCHLSLHILRCLLGTQASTRTRSLRRARGGMPLQRETRTHRHSLSLRLLRLATMTDLQGLQQTRTQSGHVASTNSHHDIAGLSACHNILNRALSGSVTNL